MDGKKREGFEMLLVIFVFLLLATILIIPEGIDKKSGKKPAAYESELIGVWDCEEPILMMSITGIRITESPTQPPETLKFGGKEATLKKALEIRYQNYHLVGGVYAQPSRTLVIASRKGKTYYLEIRGKPPRIQAILLQPESIASGEWYPLKKRR